MQIPFYLFPLSFGIVSFITSFTIFYVILLPRNGLIAKLTPGLFTHLNRLDTDPFKNEVSPIIEEKISAFLNDITAEIPMGSTLLNGSLGQSIKSKAKKAVFEMLPELKSKGVQKAQQIAIEKHRRYWKIVLLKYGTALALFAGVLGALCGLLIALCAGSSV